jgi:hypothetical protein
LADYEPHLSEYELALFKESYKHNIVVQLELTKSGVSAFEVIPVEMMTDKKVRLENGQQKEKTLEMLKEYSTVLIGEQLKKVFYKNSKNHLMIQFPAFKEMMKINGMIAVEIILLWLTKPIIIKMLTGNFLRFNLPDFFVKIVRMINMVLYKIVKIINSNKNKNKNRATDIFASAQDK